MTVDSPESKVQGPESTVQSEFCHNCGIRLSGRFCAACGQNAVPLSVTLHDFFHELVHETLHVDGRLFQTVRRLVLSPGFLTRVFAGAKGAVDLSDTSLPDIQRRVLRAQRVGARVGVYDRPPRRGWSFSLRNAPQPEVVVSGNEDEDAAAKKLGYESFAALRDAVNQAILAWVPRVMFVLMPFCAFVVSGLCETIGHRSRQLCCRSFSPGLRARRVINVATAVLMLLGGAAASNAQTPSIREESNIYGRPGWVLENGKLRVGLLRGGGHIAEVRIVSSNPRLSINPMFIPVGDGYMGHLVCFPHYGPASAEERAQGLRGHGEAGSVEWQQTRPPQIDARGLTFFYGADLPKTQYKIERAVTMNAGETAVHVEEWIENLVVYDRPYHRNQHATFGAPFVMTGRNILDMSGTRGITDPTRTAGGKWAEGQLFQWPNAPPRNRIELSLRDFHAIPGGQVYTPVLTDRSKLQSWFTLYNADYPLLVGYVFPSDDHPWIIDWQNQPRADTAAGTARGIEFGTSPFDEGLRKSVERAHLLGVPTYKFIAARQRLSTTFTIFLQEIPQGFAGVRDVRIENGKIVVESEK